jgi:hypothetical protein
MDYSKITLGELLSSDNQAIKRNATGILKQLQKGIEIKKEFFPISFVSREDIKNEGWNTKKLDDGEMQNFADKMGDAFCDDSYWLILNNVAEYYSLKPLNSSI